MFHGVAGKLVYLLSTVTVPVLTLSKTHEKTRKYLDFDIEVLILNKHVLNRPKNLCTFSPAVPFF